MKWTSAAVVALAIGLLLVGPRATANKTGQLHELSSIKDRNDTSPIATTDTIWIADWTFDDGAPCNDAGWVRYDNRILNDGSNYWHISNAFGGTGGIVNQAAVLSKHDLAWARDGYGNNWDYSIICRYQGAGATLSFDYLSDSEPGFDFVTVEADSAGASESRVNYDLDPSATPDDFRSELMAVNGVQNATVSALPLPDFGVPASQHEVYIRLASDNANSDEDGLYATSWNAGLVVDHVSVSGGLTYSENFEGALNANISLVNTAPSTPFGEWARLYRYITDNDKCTGNTTCAWLFADPTLTAYQPDMAFGPGSAVIRNWLDDIIVSPWVSLTSTPGATGTALSFNIFGGNNYSTSRIVLNWSVRSKKQFGEEEWISAWGHASSWSSLGSFEWVAATSNMTDLFPSNSSEVQVRFRVSDWQLIAGAGAPSSLSVGPGPYIDRIRIGRWTLTGPAISEGIDSRSQAQDAFATAHPDVPGSIYTPSTDRFGTAAFSMGADLGADYRSPNLIAGDSITVTVTDARGAGGITSVDFYGCIVSGPHAGKAPPPWVVEASGFFSVPGDSSRDSGGQIISGAYFVDLNDDYFRGGDVVRYVWVATDAMGGVTSNPAGLDAPPWSLEQAETDTEGLLEVSFLPTINWAPEYLERIAGDPHGQLDPTPVEVAGSSQARRLLYYQAHDDRRRSGDLNRTSFMYTLDRLGYREQYDVYDHQGFGNTNNHLGGRAHVAQCTGYSMIIYDTGSRPASDPIMPDGSDLDAQKIDQATWFRDYLAQASQSEVGIANLWVMGANVVEANPTHPLYTIDLGVSYIGPDQGLFPPQIVGVDSVTFANGTTVDFTDTRFGLDSGCPGPRDYDAVMATGAALATHAWADIGGEPHPGPPSPIVVHPNPFGLWNTWVFTFSFDDLVLLPFDRAIPFNEVERSLICKILTSEVSIDCASTGFRLFVNFEPLGFETPDYHAPDYGEAYDRSRGYGWDGQVETYQRDAVIHGPLRDTYARVPNTATYHWKCDVPRTGTYEVGLVAGSPWPYSGEHRVILEDELVVQDEITLPDEFVEIQSHRVTVTDATLDVFLGGSNTPSHTGLSYIQITEVVPADPDNIPPALWKEANLVDAGTVCSGIAVDDNGHMLVTGLWKRDECSGGLCQDGGFATQWECEAFCENSCFRSGFYWHCTCNTERNCSGLPQITQFATTSLVPMDFWYGRPQDKWLPPVQRYGIDSWRADGRDYFVAVKPSGDVFSNPPGDPPETLLEGASEPTRLQVSYPDFPLSDCDTAPLCNRYSDVAADHDALGRYYVAVKGHVVGTGCYERDYVMIITGNGCVGSMGQFPGPGQLNEVRGVATGPSSRSSPWVYVSDWDPVEGGRIMVYMKYTGTFSKKLGVGLLTDPHGLDVDAFGNIYIVDGGLIKKLSADGELKHGWAGTSGSPTDVAVSSLASFVYVLSGCHVSIYRYEHGPVGVLTSDVDGETLGPSQLSLSTYPNPFNPLAMISYSVPTPGPVRIDVYDVAGRKVATLVQQNTHEPGSFQIPFNGSGLASGIYVVLLDAAGERSTEKVVLVK